MDNYLKEVNNEGSEMPHLWQDHSRHGPNQGYREQGLPLVVPEANSSVALSKSYQNMKFIPDKLYKKIVETVPIVCVDVVLVYEDKFILVKRKTEPLKGKWWIVGGRAFKGERTIDTAKRKVKEELGLKAFNFAYLGIYEDHYRKSAWGVPTSSVSVVYEAEVADFEPKPDKTISDVKLDDYLPTRFLKNFTWQE